jgi:photosystem II stability/assembly factor-like uncharacterized protein
MYAQNDSVLSRQLEGKQDFATIMKTVKAYYTNPATVSRLGTNVVNRNLKHWRRYEYYISNRLGPDGGFVNIAEKTIAAVGLQPNRQQPQSFEDPNTSQITAGNWSLVGPYTAPEGMGRVDRLAFHPTDPNTIFAGASSGGLWKTTNAGGIWINLTPDIPALGISGIVVHPHNPNTIYILTGDGDSDGISGLVEGFGYMRLSIGVLKSTDGGATWLRTGEFPGADYTKLTGLKLVMHPFNTSILFACTNQGLYRTENGGTTWALVKGGASFFNVKFKPGSSSRCYTISLDGSNKAKFYISTDAGINFSYIVATDPLINNPTSRLDIAVAPTNENLVYILAGGVSSATGLFKGLLQSIDSGSNFVLQSNYPNILGGASDGIDSSGQSLYDLSLAVSNLSGSTVVAAAIKIWRSLDEGRAWVYRGDLHGDVHEVAFNPVDNKLWAATDGGVYSSTNNGITWNNLNESMTISQIYRMAVNPDNYHAMLAGLQDNGIKKRIYNSSSFELINGSDGFNVGYDAIDTSIYYAVINKGIKRFTNNGANDFGLTPPDSERPFAPNMAVHTTLGNALFFGEDDLWRTTDATDAANWIKSPGILGGWALQTCPSNGNRVYTAGGEQYSSTSGILRRSDNGGVTWPDSLILSNKPNFPSNYNKITYINVNPTNSNWVWITFGGYTDNQKVYVSANAGATWTNRSGSLPNLPVNCVVVDNNNNAYVGTDNGVYYWASGSNDWVPFYNNLPYIPVTDLVLSQANNKIRASTFGRGIWESSLYSVCPPVLNLVGTLEGQKFYESSGNIFSTATILPSEGTKVQMRGGNEVKLLDGFTSKENTQFRAMIGPCGSGGVAGFRIGEIDSALTLAPQQYLPPADGKKSMIHILAVANNEIQFQISQKQSGEADILLTDENGKIIRSKNFTAAEKGKWNNTINTTGLTAGRYYLQVLLNKRVEHLQEVEILK